MALSIKELQIGDWVMYNPNVFIDDEYEPYAPLEPNKIESGEDIDLAIEDCYSPIPLTVEILEKNGFKDAPAKDTDVHNLVGKWWHKSGDVYVKKYCLSHGTYAYTIGFHPHTRIENIHNVHELQHALRLCGLNDLADNFQI